MTTLTRLAFVSAALLTLCFGAGSANAFVASPVLTGISADSLATPVAMCGRTCRNGGRYIPGPPDVCYQRGLEYCGSSRGGGGGGGGGGGVGVVIPGTGVGVGVGPGGAGVVVGPGSNCRTITVQRDDGSVRRIRRCD
jgi:hypothetical protein